MNKIYYINEKVYYLRKMLLKMSTIYLNSMHKIFHRETVNRTAMTLAIRLVLSLTLLQTSVLLFGQQPTKPTYFNADSFVLAKTNEAIGKPFPFFAASNEEGKINNDSLKGKVVLINFWFEGCHPCLAEFDALNELAEKLKENKDFEFISFTWDNAETIKRVKDNYRLRFKVFQLKDGECRRLNQNMGYPTTIIIDKNGIIKYLTCGGAIDKEKAREFVMNTLLPKLQEQLK